MSGAEFSPKRMAARDKFTRQTDESIELYQRDIERGMDNVRALNAHRVRMMRVIDAYRVACQ